MRRSTPKPSIAFLMPNFGGGGVQSTTLILARTLSELGYPVSLLLHSLNGPLADFGSYGSVYGRVYQDVNLNGRFDPNVDQPQANVRVRRYGGRNVPYAQAAE